MVLFNNKTGILRGEGSDITTINGDRFTSDRFEGNLNEMILDFTGHVNGHVNDKGVITKFKGNFARVFTQKFRKI